MANFAFIDGQNVHLGITALGWKLGLKRFRVYDHGKLERVLSPNRRFCSALLKRAAREKLDFLEDAKTKIAYKS